MPIAITWDQSHFRAIKNRLQEAGAGGLTRELNKALRVAADDVKTAEQSAALRLPAKGTEHTGLRQYIATSTAVRVTNTRTNPGVVVYVKRGAGRLTSATNRQQGWRHPVYGNRNVWVRQIMSPGWWKRAADPVLPQAIERVRYALEVVAAKIAKG